MMWQLGNLLFLLFHTGSDLRERKIYQLPCFLYMLCAFVLHGLLEGKRGLIFSAAGSLAGMLLFAAARLSHQAIGYGDCLILTACGSMAGVQEALMLLFITLLGASVWAVVLLLFRKAGGKDRFPFVPFLLAAQILLLKGW